MRGPNLSNAWLNQETRIALRIGEFTPPGSHSDQTRVSTRLLFLEEIQTTAIQVLESLRDEVFNPFRNVLPIYSGVSNEIHDHADRLKIEAWLREHPSCSISADKLASIRSVVTIDGPGGVAGLEAYARDLVSRDAARAIPSAIGSGSSSDPRPHNP